MDTKQAKIFDRGRCDRVCSVVVWRLQSHVKEKKQKNQEAAPRPPSLALQRRRGDEISESVKALQDDFPNQQKAKEINKDKKEQTNRFFCLFSSANPPPDSGSVRVHRGSCQGFLVFSWSESQGRKSSTKN